jgi:hypothetical protein
MDVLMFFLTPKESGKFVSDGIIAVEKMGSREIVA